MLITSISGHVNKICYLWGMAIKSGIMGLGMQVMRKIKTILKVFLERQVV